MLTQEKEQNMMLTSWRKSPFLHCVNTPLFALCVLGDASGGLQYILNCHTAAPVNTVGLAAHSQPARTQHYLSIVL